jgi:hypothetical protein
LEHSDFFLVFVFCLAFSIATVCQSFLISAFFSEANLAAACGGFIFLIGFIPYNLIDLQGRSFRLDTNILTVNSTHLLHGSQLTNEFYCSACCQMWPLASDVTISPISNWLRRVLSGQPSLKVQCQVTNSVWLVPLSCCWWIRPFI